MKKNKFLFHLLSFTWGLPMTLLGCIVALIMIVTGHKPQRFCDHIYFQVGETLWGGLELGWIFFLTDCRPSNHTKCHEVGHSIQACVFGPLMPFIISIPSAIRYWYREWLVRSGRKKYSELPDYDSIWFEGQASKLGEKYYQSYKTE